MHAAHQSTTKSNPRHDCVHWNPCLCPFFGTQNWGLLRAMAFFSILSKSAFCTEKAEIRQYFLQFHIALLRGRAGNAVQHFSLLVELEQWRRRFGKCGKSRFNHFFTIIWTNNKLNKVLAGVSSVRVVAQMILTGSPVSSSKLSTFGGLNLR